MRECVVKMHISFFVSLDMRCVWKYELTKTLRNAAQVELIVKITKKTVRLDVNIRVRSSL